MVTMRVGTQVLLTAAVLLAVPSMAGAVTVSVSQFGDQGWRSDDTRDAAGINLVGVTSTNAGKPGQVPSATDDIAIAAQIGFVPGPAGSTYGGAVSVDGTTSNSGKSNVSVINLAGFDSASNLIGGASPFSATYEWYGQPNPTSRTLGFKLGIQSTDWAASQASFTALRSGESAWDLVLVCLPALSDNVWTTVSVDHDSGTWNLFRQAGNAYFPVPSPTAVTLDDWALDPTFGPLLFGAGAEVTSVQFGLGSSQRNSIAYLDYVQTNLLNGGDVIDFGPVLAPEPTSLGLLGLGIAGLLLRRRKA